jgi:hypothetical protein
MNLLVHHRGLLKVRFWKQSTGRKRNDRKWAVTRFIFLAGTLEQENICEHFKSFAFREAV